MQRTPNPAGKMRKPDNPYYVYEGYGWTWKVLKVNGDPLKPNQIALCAVSSPHTYGGYDMGSVYLTNIEGQLVDRDDSIPDEHPWDDPVRAAKRGHGVGGRFEKELFGEARDIQTPKRATMRTLPGVKQTGFRYHDNTLLKDLVQALHGVVGELQYVWDTSDIRDSINNGRDAMRFAKDVLERAGSPHEEEG